MKISVIVCLLWALMGPALGQGPPVVVSVDFGRRVGGVHSMVGFLHGCSDTAPTDTLLLPLHPALWRIGYMWMSNRDRLAKDHIPTILILGDSWGARVPKDEGEWEGYVRGMIKNAAGARYTWDVMNEPDLSYSFKGTQPQFFDMFVGAANVIHQQLGASTPVSGPSISHYDPLYLTAFLDDCLAHNARVDVLSWHELGDDMDETAVAAHLLDARRRFLDNPKYAPLGLKKIEINEIIGPTAQYEPGDALAYFAALEQGGADGACKGCWDDNCGNNTLDGLLTPDTGNHVQQPRAEWWAYQRYADTVAGRVMGASSDPHVVVFGAMEPGNTATVLIGRGSGGASSAPEAVALRLSGMGTAPGFRRARRLHVRVQRIPDSGTQAIMLLPVAMESEALLTRGAAALVLPPLAAHEADVVTLMPG